MIDRKIDTETERQFLINFSLSLSLYIYIGGNDQFISIAVRVFVKGPGDWCSIPGRVIPKTAKMVLDAPLLKTQHYKVWIKSKVKQS